MAPNRFTGDEISLSDVTQAYLSSAFSLELYNQFRYLMQQIFHFYDKTVQ